MSKQKKMVVLVNKNVTIFHNEINMYLDTYKEDIISVEKNVCVSYVSDPDGIIIPGKEKPLLQIFDLCAIIEFWENMETNTPSFTKAI